jgi:hypothetical protein
MPEKTSREYWADWEKNTGYERDKKEKREPREIEEWAKKTANKFAKEMTERATTGGFSVRPFAEQPFIEIGQPHIMVSLPVSAGYNQKMNLKEMSGEQATKVFERFAEKALPFLVDNPNTYLGGWIERDKSGKISKAHLDVSTRRRYEKDSDLADAIAEGKANNQISIFDVKNGKEISTGGTGD